MQRVFDAGLLFLHLDLGGSADLDHRDTAGELGNKLLELLLDYKIVQSLAIDEFSRNRVDATDNELRE
jgi:hypothetical protein